MPTPDRALPAGAPADLQPATDASGSRTGASGAGVIPGARRADRTVSPKSSGFPFGPGGMGNPHRTIREPFSRIFGRIPPAPGAGRASAALQGRTAGRFSRPRPAASVSTPYRRLAPCLRLIGPEAIVARGHAPGSADVTATRTPSRHSRGLRPVIPDARSADRTVRLKIIRFPICANGMENLHQNTKESLSGIFGMTTGTASPAGGRPRARPTRRAIRPPLSSHKAR